MTETLSQFSVLCLYSAMGVYALAFVAFAIDLAQRSSQLGKAGEPGAAASDAPLSAAERRAAARAGAGAGAFATGAAGDGGSAGSVSADGTVGAAATTTLVRPAATNSGRANDAGANGPSSAAVTAGRNSSRVIRVAIVLTVLGFILHVVATVARGIAAERVPWANMWEFSMTGTVMIVGIFLVVQFKFDLKFLGSFIMGLVLLLLGISSLRYYVDVVPLPPALQSYWLVIHILVATLATGFFALGFALSAVQLVQARRESSEGSEAVVKDFKLKFLATLPNALTLENLAYRLNVIGFILWTFTLIAGSIWAEKAWGRYWGWDTKEVWTFIIWVIYAGYIHARATRGWRGSRSAWLALVGFSAVMFNFGIVNVFFKGLHSYSGL